MKKIAFKSDGTFERGQRIIKALEDLGGVNKRVLNGEGSRYNIYYIDDNGIIDNTSFEKDRFLILDFPREEKQETRSFPREMLVSNGGESWSRRWVAYSDGTGCIALDGESEPEELSIKSGNISYYKYYKELPPKTKVSIKQIAELLDVDAESIEIEGYSKNHE